MAATLLAYQFQPSQVFIATTTDLQLIITNPAGSPAVTFAGGPKGDEIDITFPVGSSNTDLVNALTFSASCQTPGFTCGLASGNTFFAIKSPTGATLQPGQTIVVNFTGVIINGTTANPPSAATITIAEYIGSNSGQASGSITKLPPTLNIVAWLNPMVVGKRQYATLYWQSMGGINVQVAGFGSGTGIKTFPVQGDPPYPGNCPVNVPSDKDAQRTYTIRVSTSDGKHVETPVTLTQAPPVITSFSSSEPGPLTVAQDVALDWASLYAVTTYLQKADGSQLTNPILPLTLYPGKDIASLYQPGSGMLLPGTATYTLTLMGFQQPAAQSVTYQLLPVGLAFFKFSTMDDKGKLSGVTWQTDPASWSPVSADISNPACNVLTIHQPGLPDTMYYLGNGDTTHPQIQYFNAAAKPDNQYELTWVTANLSSLVLNPGNITIAAGQIAKGSMLVKDITTQTLFTLTGKTTGGETISSILPVGTGEMLQMPQHTVPQPAHKTALLTDPSCTVQVTAAGAIPNYYGAPSPAQRQDATDAIAQLNFADIWRLPPWRINQGTVRLDIQGVIAGGGRNLQIQINGIKGHSTIAAVTVQGNLATASTAARQAYVQRMVRSALVQSLGSGQLENVNGPCT